MAPYLSLRTPQTSPKHQKLLSRQEAAELLGVKEGTLSIWHTTGRYPLKVVKVGRLAKYRLSDIEEFLAQRTVTHALPSV